MQVMIATLNKKTSSQFNFQEGTKCIKCFKCDKMFRHMCTYRRHVERMHDFTPDKRLKCDECGKFFNHREGLATHVKKFHTPQVMLCFSSNQNIPTT